MKAEEFINPNMAPIQKSELEVARTKAVMSLVRRGDGKILAVKVQNKWTLPGAVFKPGETEEDCQRRGLRTCVGTIPGPSVKIYEGPNSIVHVATCSNEFRSATLAYAWMTEEQFLRNTLQPRALFERVFAASRTKDVADSKVISKLKDGRILFAIQYEVWNVHQKNWVIELAHYVHAMSADLARQQFNGLRTVNDPPVRIIGVAPAIGFHQDEKGDLIA